MQDNSWSPILGFKLHPIDEKFNIVFLTIIDWVKGTGEKPELYHIAPNGVTKNPLFAGAIYISPNVGEGWIIMAKEINKNYTVEEVLEQKHSFLKDFSTNQEQILLYRNLYK